MRIAVCVLCAVAVLSGCVSNPSVQTATVTVTVPCVNVAPTHEAFATTTLKSDADVFEKGRAVAAERVQRVQYEREMEAAIAACLVKFNQ